MNPMLANIVFEFFSKGGPVMWPILASAVVAVAVVGERTFWWLRESSKRDPHKMEQLLAALENGDVATAKKIAEGSDDSVIRMIRHGLNHIGGVHSSLLGALQLAGGHRTQTRWAVPHRHGHARYARAFARLARHGNRIDARVS